MALPSTTISLILLTTTLPFLSASYQNMTQLMSGNKHLLKRWYGVKSLHPPQVLQGYGQWPGAIRYCWKDQRSHDRLTPILEQAITRWQPAMRDSTLDFQLDRKDSPLCSGHGVRGDALVISDETRDTDRWYNEHACATRTTTGYYYPGKDEGDDHSGRHTLKFCHLMPGAEEQDTATAVVAMMHELGHAVGLTHEHQRADRDKYLKFRCQNLEGFDEAIKDVEGDDNLFGDEDLNMRVTCSTYIAAAAHFPPALDFLKGPELSTTEGNDISGERWDAYTYSTKFSTSSIMLYASSTGAQKPESCDPEDWVLSRKTWVQDELVEVPVYVGGEEDPRRARLSVGDAARVAQLYPKPDGASEAAMRLAKWSAISAKVPAEGEYENSE